MQAISTGRSACWAAERHAEISPGLWPSQADTVQPEAAKRAIRERLERLRSPFRSAERFYVEEIIPPSETRRWLCEFADLAAGPSHAVAQGFHYRP